MKKHTFTRTIPENPQWISVHTGCPRKQICQVKVRLYDGKIVLARYSVRNKQWTLIPSGEPLKNVVAWKLLETSFELPNQETNTTSNPME